MTPEKFAEMIGRHNFSDTQVAVLRKHFKLPFHPIHLSLLSEARREEILHQCLAEIDEVDRTTA
jgi:hypothetical protein